MEGLKKGGGMWIKEGKTEENMDDLEIFWRDEKVGRIGKVKGDSRVKYEWGVRKMFEEFKDYDWMKQRNDFLLHLDTSWCVNDVQYFYVLKLSTLHWYILRLQPEAVFQFLFPLELYITNWNIV